MLSFPSAVKIFLCLEPTDMRRSFDGLAALVQQQLRQDPLSGHVFVFRNRRGDRVKLLYWDRDGFALWYKRLEKGVFSLPSVPDDSDHRIDQRQLSMLLEGFEASAVRCRKRFAVNA